MAISLKKKYDELRTEGIESMTFAKGYIIDHHPGKYCALALADKTTIDNKGNILHKGQSIHVEFKYCTCKEVGQGTCTELLDALKDNNIACDNKEEIAQAIQKGQILYLPATRGIFCITKKEERLEHDVDDQIFYTTTQREEAIAEVVSHVKECTKKLFKSALQEKDFFAIAQFVSSQFP